MHGEFHVLVTRKLVAPAWAAFGTALVLLTSGLATSPAAAEGPLVPQALLARAARDGRVRVIVEFNPRSGRHVPEGRLSGVAAATQRSEIRSAAARVRARLRFRARDEVRDFETVPYLVLDLDSAGLAALESASADIVQVVDDAILRPTLADSVPLIQGDQVVGGRLYGPRHDDRRARQRRRLDASIPGRQDGGRGVLFEQRCGRQPIGVPERSAVATRPWVGRAVPPAGMSPRDARRRHRGRQGAAAPACRFPVSRRTRSSWRSRCSPKITNAVSCGGAAPCMGAFTSDIIAGSRARVRRWRRRSTSCR